LTYKMQVTDDFVAATPSVCALIRLANICWSS
jgi:hypothetical protein